MSSDSGKTDIEDLPEDEVASSGAAADSAETDKKLAGLPRLLRYALLATNNGFLIEARLTAEIETLCPGLHLNAAWARERLPDAAAALSEELDHRAVTDDKPELRGLADSVRLLSLPAPTVSAHLDLHRRVAKALLMSQRALSSEIDPDLAAEIETFCWGWAALPAATDFINRHERRSAVASALIIGRRMAENRIAAAEQAIEKRDCENQRGEKVSASKVRTDGSNSPAVPGQGLIICRIDEPMMKAGKTREIAGPFKAFINTPVPLQAVPPLRNVRDALLLEFPYAQTVIDFALMDLVGRSTVRLRPLLLVGDPGGGKTRFGRRLGQLLGVHVWHTDASRADGAVFGGTDKRWHSAEPCHPLLAIARGGHANPLVLVDELEKAGTRADYGRLWDCLLGFLEPETASRYPDPALQASLDLSHVSYVATANGVANIPSPLLDRFRIADFPKPAADDVAALLPAILADLAAERGLDARWIAPFDASEKTMIVKYWNGGSVRRLRRIVDAMVQERDRIATKN
jgi:ATP-dependent Lon protease